MGDASVGAETKEGTSELAGCPLFVSNLVDVCLDSFLSYFSGVATLLG